MKKKLLYGLCCALSFSICACSSDDPKPDPEPDPIPNPTPDPDPEPDQEPASLGFYVLNQGNMGYGLEGSLTAYDYVTQSPLQNAFQTVNNRSLGNTPQTAIAYGSHIYIGVYQSNTIEIINRWTYEAQKQISLADAEGQSPRSMVAKDGKVYISMFNGYVSRLDTLTLEIDKNVKVGPNPEIMAIRGNYLYVPNSDGLNYPDYGTTASKIDLSSFTATTFNVELNPSQFASNGEDLFLLCKGNYGNVASKVYKVGEDDSLSEIAEATLIDVDEENLYYINAPWGVETITYKKYNIEEDASADLLADNGVESPAWLAVDPIHGCIIVTSYSMDNGWASYGTDGYAKIYDADGQLLQQISAGVGPVWIFFSTYNMD